MSLITVSNVYLEDFTCYFRYTEVSSQAERDRIEEELLESGKYECNKQQKQI